MDDELTPDGVVIYKTDNLSSLLDRCKQYVRRRHPCRWCGKPTGKSRKCMRCRREKKDDITFRIVK